MLGPLFARLMPGVPRGHPAVGLITMNFAANGIGLDNAATPIGLSAMRALQTLNPRPDTATDAQILFLALNASSLTLLPVSIFVYRLQQGAAEPTLVFMPILLATSASTLSALLAVAWMQRLRIGDPVVLAWLGGIGLALGAAVAALAGLSATALAAASSLAGSLALFGLMLAFLVTGLARRVPVYDCFVDGARQGFDVARDLLPYLVAMLCAIGLLRASGALDALLSVIRFAVDALGVDGRFIDALPTALVKPFSGSAARDADRDDADVRRRQLSGARRRDGPGQHRDDLLRARGLLRRSRHPACTACGRLRADRRRRRHRGGDRRLLLVLRLVS